MGAMRPLSLISADKVVPSTIFEDQPGRLAVEPGVVKRHDIGMRKLAHDQSFVQQRLNPARALIGSDAIQGKRFNGYPALQLRVLGEIDLALPAFAERAQDLEAADPGRLGGAEHLSVIGCRGPSFIAKADRLTA